MSASLERRISWILGKGYGAATIVQEVETAVSLLGRRPTLAVDVGGNVGEYSGRLIAVCPGLEVHVFEPATINISRLRDRFRSYPNVRLQHAALSDAPGRMELFADRQGSGMASLAKRNLGHLNLRFEAVEEVEVCRFEDYWRTALSERTIDIVKIDVEGFELKVLNGFGPAIHRVRLIQFEFGGTCIDTKVFFKDLWAFFEQAGFDLFRVTPLGLMKIHRYSERDEHFIITNYMAVSRCVHQA